MTSVAMATPPGPPAIDPRKFWRIEGSHWSEVAAEDVADSRCECRGRGVIDGRVCPCVYRAAFRRCHRTFGALRESIELSGGKLGRGTITASLAVEFMADFVLLARRALDNAAFRCFCHVVLRGRGLLLPRRTEEALGRAFSETEPYGIYPPARYFTCLKR